MDSPLSATQTKKPEGSPTPRETLTVTDNRTGATYEIPIEQGAIHPWGGVRSEYFSRVLDAVADTYGFSTKTPWSKLKKSD